MAPKITGNIRGLSVSELAQVERLYTRKIEPHQLVSMEFARELWGIGNSLRRRVGALISREGRVQEVFIGTKELLYLPNLGRYRLDAGRLRRLRLIFSDLSSDPAPEIPLDIYADLEKLRLDLVASVKVDRNQLRLKYAYNVPLRPGSVAPAVVTEVVKDVGRLELDYLTFITDLEAQHASSVRTQTIVGGQIPAILVGVYDRAGETATQSQAELRELARTAGLNVVETVVQYRKPDPRTLLGKGKLEEVILTCLRLGVDLIVFDTELRPSQWRSIINSTDLKVIDRSMLILDIFAQRATSSEGRLQVELAQLKYNLPRLVEKDAGLSRLTGGIGGRGPGETKLEIGRRRTRERITRLEQSIEKLKSRRAVTRQRREQRATPLAAIIGYTNVGKSTLFNALTQSEVIVEDKLFATLDPAQRRVYLTDVAPDQLTIPGLPEVVLTDTVGFIRDLPQELFSAFRATLEELSQAQLLVHVLDASDIAIEQRRAAVQYVLREMGLDHLPQLMVLNKTDLVSPQRVADLQMEHEAVIVSALRREGLRDVRQALYDGLYGFRHMQLTDTKPGGN